MTNISISNHGKRARRGVGAIIGGVILVTILVTSVLIYYLSVLNSDKVKATYDIESAQFAQDKATEKLVLNHSPIVTGCPDDCHMDIDAKNRGPITVVVSDILLYCIDNLPTTCSPTPNDPIEQLPPGTSITLNPDGGLTRTLSVSDNLKYRIDMITERGNKASTIECRVDAATGECIDTGVSTEPDFILSIDKSAFALTAGSPDPGPTVTVSSQVDFSAPVTLTVSPTSAGGISISPPTATLTPSPGSPQPQTFAISTTSSAIGTQVFTVLGSSPGYPTKSVQFSVSIITVTGAVNEGIVQGTGSLQLDFKAFGSIYPTTATDGGLASRGGVNQEGWLVKTYSKYGGVTGYPGFDILGGAHTVVFVERIRNLDPSTDDITLARASGLVTNLGSIPSGQQAAEWICNATKSFSVAGDPTGGLIQSYAETTTPKRVSVIPSTPLNAAPTEGWRELYFCSNSIGGGVTNFHPFQEADGGSFKPNEIQNGLFLVARGTFDQSKSDYGQTIPYQSYTVGSAAVNSFEACLRTDNTLGTACPGPNTACNFAGTACSATTQKLIYSAPRNIITTSGVNVWLHLDTIPAPNKVTVSWIYHDGTVGVMNTTNGVSAQDVPIVGGYLSDGTVARALKVPINLDACDETDPHPQYYTIKVTDSFGATGQRNVYYMTFEVTC
jgi:hypothetical protein